MGAAMYHPQDSQIDGRILIKHQMGTIGEHPEGWFDLKPQPRHLGLKAKQVKQRLQAGQIGFGLSRRPFVSGESPNVIQIGLCFGPQGKRPAQRAFFAAMKLAMSKAVAGPEAIASSTSA